MILKCDIYIYLVTCFACVGGIHNEVFELSIVPRYCDKQYDFELNFMFVCLL